MNENLIANADWLGLENNAGYGPQPIPVARDFQVRELLEAWLALKEAERAIASANVLEDQRLTLLAYSERMASLAVRTSDQSGIYFGLIALGIDGWRFDFRDNLTVVALHHDAALRMGASPAAIFNRAASVLPLRSARGLRDFSARNPGDQTPEAMGYIAGTDSDGFRYKRTW